jgi:hypothetical protein
VVSYSGLGCVHAGGPSGGESVASSLGGVSGEGSQVEDDPDPLDLRCVDES